MGDKLYKVYQYLSPSNKRYIGQTCTSLKVRSGSNGQKYWDSPKFFNAIKKYGFNNFQMSILKEGLSKDEADYWEKYYIDKYQTTSDKFGYNLSEGGEGLKPNAETRKKMSLSHLGKKHNEETKQKISNANKNKIVSEETRKKISETRKKKQIPSSFKDHHHTEEAKKKIGQKNGRKVQCLETGQIFNSGAEACRFLGLKSNHISDHISNPNRYKTIGGYHWKYID